MNLKTAVVLGLLMILVAGLLPSVVSAEEEYDGRPMWFLDDDLAVGPGGAEHIMYQSPNGEAVNEEETSVEVGIGECVIWRADYSAIVDNAFVCGDDQYWEGKLMLIVPSGNDTDKCMKNMVLQLGYVDDDAGFTNVGEMTLSDKLHEFSDNFVVPEGSYLALKVCNNNPELVEVRTGSSHGYLKAPSAVPQYPLPEIATIVLVAAGLVGLVGYLGIRRRKALV